MNNHKSRVITSCLNNNRANDNKKEKKNGKRWYFNLELEIQIILF